MPAVWPGRLPVLVIERRTLLQVCFQQIFLKRPCHDFIPIRSPMHILLKSVQEDIEDLTQYTARLSMGMIGSVI
jgi:hypothetical protein